MADDAFTMPAAGVADDSDEQRRRLAFAMPPAATPAPPPVAASATMPHATMPPAGVGASTPAPPVSTASVMPPARLGGTPEPGTLQPESSPQPRANVMPPAQAAQSGTPVPGTLKPESSSNGPAGFMPPAPVQAPEKTIPNVNAPAPQPPELHGWRKYLDAIGSVFPIGRAIETAIPGTPQNFEMTEAQRQGRAEKEAEIGQKRALASQEESRAETLKGPPEKVTGTPEEQTLHDLMTGNNGGPQINQQTGRPYTYLEAYQATKQAGEKPTATSYEHATIADPKNPQGRDVLFDRTKGQYLDPNTRQVITDARPFEKPPAPNEQDKAISDYLAANKLTDTPANRDKARTAIIARNRVGGYGEPGGDLNLSGDAYLQSLDPAERAFVSEIGTGRAAPERIAYIVARNPKLLAELALAYPDLDTAKLAAYPEAYKKFTSGPESLAINAGNTALLHLNELRKLNTDKSRIPGTEDYQKYQNKLDTISSELGRFYGNTTLEGIAGYRKTLGAIFNRDAAIRTQAQSMGDKLDSFENQWMNAAPSKAYQAPLPGISDAAKKARAELDPNYKYEGKAGGAGGAKTYTDAEVQAAVAAHPGQTAAQIESAYKAKGYSKR